MYILFNTQKKSITSDDLHINNTVVVGQATNASSSTSTITTTTRISPNVIKLTPNESSSNNYNNKIVDNTNPSSYSISSPSYTASSSSSSLSSVTQNNHPQHHQHHNTDDGAVGGGAMDDSTIIDGPIEVCEKVIVDRNYRTPTPFIKVVDLKPKQKEIPKKVISFEKPEELTNTRFRPPKLFQEISHTLDDAKRFSLDIKDETMKKLNSMLNDIKLVNTNDNSNTNN